MKKQSVLVFLILNFVCELRPQMSNPSFTYSISFSFSFFLFPLFFFFKYCLKIKVDDRWDYLSTTSLISTKIIKKNIYIFWIK